MKQGIKNISKSQDTTKKKKKKSQLLMWQVIFRKLESDISGRLKLE